MSEPSKTPLGQLALYEALGRSGAPPFVQSHLVSGARRIHESDSRQEERYPVEYRTNGTPLGHLRFARRHKPLDLRIIMAALRAIGGEDVPAAKTGNYVDALDPKLRFMARSVNSPRRRVRDNGLGAGDLYPTVRRTSGLEAAIAAHLNNRAQTLDRPYPINLVLPYFRCSLAALFQEVNRIVPGACSPA